ncbi:MAG: hypothetical protein D6737_13845 [Chloroflexi bacterium]|nr:MAG: hypothetical protein D6737_13845 [Chloroflexota bacterium]
MLGRNTFQEQLENRVEKLDSAILKVEEHVDLAIAKQTQYLQMLAKLRARRERAQQKLEAARNGEVPVFETLPLGVEHTLESFQNSVERKWYAVKDKCEQVASFVRHR